MFADCQPGPTVRLIVAGRPERIDDRLDPRLTNDLADRVRWVNQSPIYLAARRGLAVARLFREGVPL